MDILGLVGEENAIEVIDLVLHDPGGEVLQAECVFASFWIDERYLHPAPPLDITGFTWY